MCTLNNKMPDLDQWLSISIYIVLKFVFNKMKWNKNVYLNEWGLFHDCNIIE